MSELGTQTVKIRLDWTGLADDLRKLADQIAPEVVHGCPVGDDALTPCCGRTPFELPRTDRMTNDDALVTCSPVSS